MVAMTVELRNVEGTEAAMGWAGGHTIVVDRPEGKAGGNGLRSGADHRKGQGGQHGQQLFSCRRTGIVPELL